MFTVLACLRRPLLILATGFGILTGTPSSMGAESRENTILQQTERGSWLWDLLSKWFGRAREQERQEKAKKLVNGGNPVPVIAEDDQSSNFIKERIAEDALDQHEMNYAEALESYDYYAAGLTKTLSQLTPEEQNEVFYGSGE